MKSKFIYPLITFTALLFLFSSCKKDHTGTSLPAMSVSGSDLLQDFGTVVVGQTSSFKSLQVTGSNLTNDISISASTNYKVSFDNTNFSAALTIAAADSKGGKTIYIRFYPTETGVKP